MVSELGLELLESRIDIEGSFDRVFVEEEDGSFFGFPTSQKKVVTVFGSWSVAEARGVDS